MSAGLRCGRRWRTCARAYDAVRRLRPRWVDAHRGAVGDGRSAKHWPAGCRPKPIGCWPGCRPRPRPREMGAKSWNQVLRIRWRLSTGEASRRLHEAADLAARTSLTGQPLAPLLPAVAAAQSAGLITGEHVGVIRDALKRLPSLGRHHHRRTIRGRPGARRGRCRDPQSCARPPTLRLFLLDQDGPDTR